MVNFMALGKNPGIGQGKGGGGKQKGAGRPQGAITKKNQEIQLRAIEQGITPMEVLLEDMRYFHNLANIQLTPIMYKEFDSEENIELLKRVMGLKSIARECAESVAAFIHPKLASIDAKVSLTNQETALAELE